MALSLQTRAVMRSLSLLTLSLALAACAPPQDSASPDETGTPQHDRLGSSAPTAYADPLAGRTTNATAPDTPKDKLVFAAWGDSRPDNNPGLPPNDFETDYKNRLLPILNKIFKNSFDYGSQFMLGSGDYINAYMPDPGNAGLYDTPDKWDTGCVTQYNFMKTAAEVYTKAATPRPVYYALGNHEALGWTDLYTINYNETPNIKEYLKLMLPANLKPYYSFTMQIPSMTAMGKMKTAKFVFIAPNAWSDDQSIWLTQTMRAATDYTFVVRHEANDQHGCDAPGMLEQNTLLGVDNPVGRKYTLLIQGHEHEYRRDKGSPDIVAGNGGAQKNTAGGINFYGYITVEQVAKDDRMMVRAWDINNPAKPWEEFYVAGNGQVSKESRFP